jgi:hypothetical protein
VSERAWLCEFARDDGFGGFVRLEVREAVVWYWAYLANVPGIDGVIAVRDHEIPLPRQGLEIRAEGLWAELVCEQPGEHWTIAMEAFGVRLDEDAFDDEIGDRIAVGLDIEWELGDIVHGDVLVGRERNPLEAWGRFVQRHELLDEPHDGPVVARVVVPGWVERTLVRTADGLRWAQRVTTG